jgi:hypothetical protein
MYLSAISLGNKSKFKVRKLEKCRIHKQFGTSACHYIKIKRLAYALLWNENTG